MRETEQLRRLTGLLNRKEVGLELIHRTVDQRLVGVAGTHGQAVAEGELVLQLRVVAEIERARTCAAARHQACAQRNPTERPLTRRNVHGSPPALESGVMRVP